MAGQAHTDEESVERLKASIENAKRLKAELDERLAEMAGLLEQSEQIKRTLAPVSDWAIANPT
jgi:prefoldin subunit 5